MDKKPIRYVDENTLEIKELKDTPKTTYIEELLGCDVNAFAKAYKKYKKAEKEFNELYEPLKEKLINLHAVNDDIPKSISMNNTVKITYIAPTTRSTLDTKMLKEEEPELVKKYTKITNVKPSIRLDDLITSTLEL